MTEQEIQVILFKEYVGRGHCPIAPNCMALGYEADLLSVTSAGYAYEFEIKVTRSDFLADKNKVQKHKQYAGTGLSPYYRQARRCPSKFWYVMPTGLAAPEEVPSHAGLIYVDPENSRLQVVKEAPRLHSHKLHQDVYFNIMTSLMYKVFNGVTKRQPMKRTINLEGEKK